MKRTIYITFHCTEEIITSKHDHRTSDGFFHSQWRDIKWCGPLVSSEDFLFSSEDISSIKAIISINTPRNTTESWGETKTYEEPDIYEFYKDLGIAEKINEIIKDKYPFVFEPTSRKLDYSLWDALNKSIIDPVKNYQSKEESLNKEYDQSLYNLKKDYRHSLYDYYNENLITLLTNGIIDSNCILPNLDVYPFDIACLKLNKEAVMKMIAGEYKYCKNEWVVYYVCSNYWELLPALINNEYNSIFYDNYNIDEKQFNVLSDIYMRSIYKSARIVRIFILKKISKQGNFNLFDLFIGKCEPTDLFQNRYEKYSVLQQHILLYASIINKRTDLFRYLKKECFTDYYYCKNQYRVLSKEEYFEALTILETDDDMEKAFNCELHYSFMFNFRGIREQIKNIKDMSNDEINKIVNSNYPNALGKVEWEDL